VIIASLCTRGDRGEKNLLVVVMCEYKPCALAFLENIDGSGGLGKRRLSVGTEAVNCCEKTHFESRKKRPFERGKKKRRKGKRDPLSLLWKSTYVKNCNSEHLPN
jgi:hypothetical protein